MINIDGIVKDGNKYKANHPSKLSAFKLTVKTFRGRQAPLNQDESRVIGLRRGEKITSLLTTDFFDQKINLNSYHVRSINHDIIRRNTTPIK